MSRILNYGVITDDPEFAASISSYLFEKNSYVSVISLPRMNRIDWESEVLKRTLVINRSKLEYMFCKSKDYGLLAPIRKYSNAEIIALKKPKHIKRFINIDYKEKYFTKKNNDFLIDYINSIINDNIIKKVKKSKKYPENYEGKIGRIKNDTLLVLEKTGEVTDISAINYAMAYNYDIFIINEIDIDISNEISNCLVMFSDMNIVFNENGELNNHVFNRLLNFLNNRLSYILDYRYFENNYKRILFVTKKTYLGLLIKSIPVAHLLHLQADIHFLNEYYYLDKFKQANDKNIPSFLFVDTQDEELSSEVPEISTNLSEYKCWKFYLNGNNASRSNFKIYSHFFPYDVLLISGHGDSPNARIVTYKFNSSNGKEHVAKILEYYQLGPGVGDMIYVELKQYPLEFDGIPWKDKKQLKRHGITHIFWEFTKAKDNLTMLKFSKVKLNKIEGIKLFDGIFMGNIEYFEIDNNPIILLNSCGSLVEVGEIVNFGIPRVLIGTLWPVLDKSAKDFAVNLFNNLTLNTVLDSFHNAKSNIDNDYTKYSYIMLGTLNQILPMTKNVSDQNIVEEYMKNRILKSISEIQYLYYKGHLPKDTLKSVINFVNNCEKFFKQRFSNDFEIQSNINKLRILITSNT